MKKLLYLCNVKQKELRSQQDKVGKNIMKNIIINEIKNNANSVIVAFSNSDQGVVLGDYYFGKDLEALIASVEEAYGEVISVGDERHAEIAETAFNGEITSDIYAFCNEGDPNRLEGFNIFFALI